MKHLIKLLFVAAAAFGIWKAVEQQRALPPADDAIWKPADPASETT